MPNNEKMSLCASKEGFFLKNANSNERVALTREQFDDLLSKNKFTESRLEVNPGHYGEWISMQLESYIEQRKSGKSQYGERVILKPVDINETVIGEAVNIQGNWQCFTESGKYLHDTGLTIENLTGPIVKTAINAHLSVVEILKTIIQLNMSGASANDEDEKPLETLLELMENNKRQIIKCTWTLCEYCHDIQGIEGVCVHPNGAEDMVNEGAIKVKDKSMISCEMYSRRKDEVE